MGLWCAVCFTDVNSLYTTGYNYGIVTLLIITLILLSVFGWLLSRLLKHGPNKSSENTLVKGQNQDG